MKQKWTYWYLNNDSQARWEDRLKPVYTFSTVEEFWASLMQVKNGSPGDVLDSIWLELLLAMTGEQFGDDSDLICGLVCNVREKGSKIKMWTKDWKEEEGNMRIGFKNHNKTTQMNYD
ncbi:unnamed protein product [Strongylus vulgaris]|uniref:EIF-4F 25 kDa subunit n=1 Tax=Strongylus vulgaris TaxID=40348 RepID=A0A3P7JFV7_STRVU|nr:unnamed protein product [Strongylus vulgaris]